MGDVVGKVAGTVGGLAGDIVGSAGEGLGVLAPEGVGQGAYDRALGIQQKVFEEAKKLDIPDIEAQKLALEIPELVGRLDPEEIRDRIAEISPRARELQLEGIEGIRELSKQGLTDEDRAAFEALRGEVAREEQARRGAILQSMAERGALDSGQQLAAQLQAGQSAAQAGREGAMEIAGQSAAARREALGKMTQAGSQLRGQDIQQAQAQSAIDRFNAAQRAETAQQNLAESQRMAEKQAEMRNVQQRYNKELQQQEYQNQLQRLNAMSGAGQQLAGGYQQKGAMEATGAQQRAAGTMGLIKTGVSAIAGKGDVPKITDEAADGGIKYADGGYEKMGYEEVGPQTNGRITPGENFAGDELEDRINSGEMVLNVEQQDRLNDMLQELQATREGKRDNGDYRVDEALEDGELGVNDKQQNKLMAVLRGEQSVMDLPKEDIIERENRGLKRLLSMLGSK